MLASMDGETVRLLAMAAGLLAVMAAILVVNLHTSPTNVDPLTDGVSGYALTSVGILYRIQVIITGASALLLALSLTGAGLASGVAVALLAVFGISRIAIAQFATDPRGTATLTPTGRIHALLAAITFTTIAVAAPAIAGSLVSDPAWSGSTALVTAIAWATTIFALATFAAATTPATRRVFGLVERGAYAGMLSWLAIAAMGIRGPA
jgi:hypothetical protein